jgi:hypothetical protein
MGRLKIKKKPKLAKPKLSNTPKPGTVEMVGFQEFWQTAYDLNRGAFDEVSRIGHLQNMIFATPSKTILERVIRHLAKNAMNSLGAASTLCLNGYGHDAMKLARSIYENYLNATYLEKHPEEIDDYIDFFHVQIKQQLDNLDRDNQQLAKQLPAERRNEIMREYIRVEARFRKGKYHRSHWCKKAIWEMAEDVGLKEHHATFYANTSNIHHASAWGLTNQIEEATGDAEIAPSVQHLESALFSAHMYALGTTEVYDSVAKLGHASILRDARDAFGKVWAKKIEVRVEGATG